MTSLLFFFFFSSRRRHTRLQGDWSSDVCSSDLTQAWSVGSIIGVPAASPALAGAGAMACTGQTSMQSPQRVQDARNAISGAAPGGRNQRRGADRKSVV